MKTKKLQCPRLNFEIAVFVSWSHLQGTPCIRIPEREDNVILPFEVYIRGKRGQGGTEERVETRVKREASKRERAYE